MLFYVDRDEEIGDQVLSSVPQPQFIESFWSLRNKTKLNVFFETINETESVLGEQPVDLADKS